MEDVPIESCRAADSRAPRTEQISFDCFHNLQRELAQYPDERVEAILDRTRTSSLDIGWSLCEEIIERERANYAHHELTASEWDNESSLLEFIPSAYIAAKAHIAIMQQKFWKLLPVGSQMKKLPIAFLKECLTLLQEVIPKNRFLSACL